MPFLRDHWRAVLTLLVSVMVPFVLFTHLAHEIFREGGFPWDQAILNWYAHHRTPALTSLSKILAQVGGPVILPFMVLAIAWLLRQAHGNRTRGS